MATQTEYYDWVKEVWDSNNGFGLDNRIAAETFFEIAVEVGKQDSAEILEAGLLFQALAKRGSPRNDLTLVCSMLADFCLWDEAWRIRKEYKKRSDFF